MPNKTPLWLLRALLAVLLVVLCMTIRTDATHSGSVCENRKDPATGFIVCHCYYFSSNGYYSGGFCIGECREQFSHIGRRRSNRSFQTFVKRETPENYNCSAIGTCVRSPSNGCNWLGIQDFRVVAMVNTATINCTESSPGVCRWFSDPFCTVEIPPESAPKSRFSSCQANDTKFFENGTWCADAVSYMQLTSKPKDCPDVTETQSLPKPFEPTGGICIRSCDDKGNYVKVYNVNGKVVCEGPIGTNYDPEIGTYKETKCSWYSDSNCKTLAPGEPAPEYLGGLLCKQTTEGWCKLASDVLFRNETAPTLCGTETALSVLASTTSMGIFPSPTLTPTTVAGSATLASAVTSTTTAMGQEETGPKTGSRISSAARTERGRRRLGDSIVIIVLLLAQTVG